MASICQYEPASAGASNLQGLSGRRSGTKPLHVLTLTPFYPIAGDDAAGCFVAEPLAYLDEFGIRNSVIATRPFYRGTVKKNTDVASATWVRYAALPGLAGLSTAGRALYWQIRAAVERLNAAQPLSLIHAHGALPCGHAALLLARSLRVPFVVTVHGRDVFSSRKGGLTGDWRTRVSTNVYRSATRVICISRRVQEDLLSSVECCSTVVYNGVDTDMFSPSTSQENDQVVLSVGNLIPIKGHESLLRAVAAVRGRYPHILCRMIGVGPEQQRLASLARKLGLEHCVEFLGRRSRSEVAHAMKGCSVFVLPSSYEGLGCVYLEAMAAAKPAIGCTGQGIAEVIESGRNGWLVRPGDGKELADALLQLLGNSELRNRLGLAARHTVVENFALHKQAEQLARIYGECAL